MHEQKDYIIHKLAVLEDMIFYKSILPTNFPTDISKLHFKRQHCVGNMTVICVEHDRDHG